MAYGGERRLEPLELRVAVLRNYVLVEVALALEVVVRVSAERARRVLSAARVPAARLRAPVLGDAWVGVEDNHCGENAAAFAAQLHAPRVVAVVHHPVLEPTLCRKHGLRRDVVAVGVVPKSRDPRNAKRRVTHVRVNVVRLDLGVAGVLNAAPRCTRERFTLRPTWSWHADTGLNWKAVTVTEFNYLALTNRSCRRR